MKSISITVGKNEERILPFIFVDDVEGEFEVEARLIGEGASLSIVGIFLGSKDCKLTFNTIVIHEAPMTKSVTSLRGVFGDNASFSNDGLITIKKGAKGADGYFSSKILLFDSARGRSVPSLEIDENDLKAGHASTVGRPDPMQIFYLRSRGLTEKEAVALIVAGFFVPLLSYLPEKERTVFKKRLSTLVL